MIKNMDLEFILTQMVVLIKDNGPMGNSMVKGILSPLKAP